MDIELFKPQIKSFIEAPPSKSHVIRLLIAAAISDKKTEIKCSGLSEDTKAAADCLRAMGADISYDNGFFTVEPIKDFSENPVLLPKESASVLRFLLPLICRAGKGGMFITEGTLTGRTLSPLKEILMSSGAVILQNGPVINVQGKSELSDISITGEISSQFITGLIFMLTLSGGRIEITDSLKSRPYVEMTIAVLKDFGCEAFINGNEITVNKCCPLKSSGRYTAESDWSSAAYLIGAGVTGESPVNIMGLNMNSLQGDRKIIDILRASGADISYFDGILGVYPSELDGTVIDASDIPDLVSVLAVIYQRAEGRTVINNISRLKLKESDRINSTCEMIKALGGSIKIENDSMIIEGSSLSGGTVYSFNDHRIAMSAAVCSVFSDNTVIIKNAEAVNKSYPDFFSVFN